MNNDDPLVAAVKGVPLCPPHDDGDSLWRTVDVIPCTVPCEAEFTDGQCYPVLCWAHQFHADESGEFGVLERVVGMVIIQNSVCLGEVTSADCDDFSHYNYGK